MIAEIIKNKYFQSSPVDVFVNIERISIELNKSELFYYNRLINTLRVQSLDKSVIMPLVELYEKHVGKY